MEELITGFTGQLREAMSIAQNYSFIAAKDAQFSNVILTGLGGSGIGGSIVQNYVADKMKVPFIVNKDYSLPAFVDANSLVIASSYSGNTEETIAALNEALKKKATIVCITSGGKIAEIAKKKKIDCILMPSGMPPRACLGYSMVQVLHTLAYFGFIKNTYVKELNASISLLDTEERDIRKKAKAIAAKISGKLPIIYSAANYEGMAIRFRQQLNENSKILAWHSPIPEMNHNELVGWREKDDHKAVIILRNDNDYERIQLRMDINKKVIRKYTPNIIELYSKGSSYWERLFYFVHVTDYVSIELAALKNQDATEVRVIDFLKGELSNA